jgi:transposase-like protein
VLQMMLEENVEQYAGPCGKHNTPERTGYRHGIEDTTVVMDGQKVRVKRPRVHAADGSGKLPLETLNQFQNEDPLNKKILAKLLNGVCIRKYERTLDMETTDVIGTSKSSVSCRFIDGMETLTEEFFNRKIEGEYPAIMIDGTKIGEMTVIAAMGLDNECKKHILGITGGGTENSESVKNLLSDLIEKGLDANSYINSTRIYYDLIIQFYNKLSIVMKNIIYFVLYYCFL